MKKNNTRSRCLASRIMLLLLLMSFAWQGAIAQNQTIHGVIQSDQGSPVTNATIKVKGSSHYAISKDDGRFEIQAAIGDSLMITHIGLIPLTIAVTSSTLQVMMQSSADASAGTDVIVTALGIKREAKSIGYSVQKVTGDDITKASAPDLASGLMGKSAGLNITQSNGVQGNSSRIVIRGNNSILGSNQPLIVVDGIQVQNNPIGGQSATTNSTDLVSPKDWGSFLNSLNSDDIEDITVLKGASAAALYGARGSNGVILITTKKGKTRPGLGLDYNFSTYATDPYQYQDVQNKYGYGGANAMWSANLDFPKTADGQLRYPGNYPWDGTPAGDAYEIGGPIPGGYSSWDVFSWYGPAASWGHKLDGTEIIWWDGVKRKWDPQPDNRSAFYRTGHTTSHNVSFSNAGDWGSFRVAYTRQDNSAIIQNSDYNQNTFNFGGNFKISNKLTAEVTGTYTNYHRLNVPDIANDNGWSQFTIYNMSRDYKPLEFDSYKNPDGSKNIFTSSSAFGFYPYNNNWAQDLFWHVFEQNQSLSRNQLLGSLKLSADLLPWLNITGRSSINYATTDIESKYTPIDAAGVEGQYGMESIQNKDVNLELFTTIHKDNFLTSGLNASLMVGNSALKSRSYDNSAWNSGEPGATYGQASTNPWSVPYKYFLSNTTAAGLSAPTEVWNDYNINSLFGILNLSYNDYLFLQVSGRNDWSSTLPVETSSYFFPSASLSWVFTQSIKSMKNLSWLDYGKLRVSASGSANGTDPYLSTYTYSSNVISNYLNGTAPTAFGGVPVRGYQSVLPPAGFLVPQRNSSYEVGLEASILKNRLNFDFTYYKTKATSQILQGNLAWSSGAQKVTFNTGELSNQGFEFIVRASAIRSKNFGWDLVLNGAHNQNKVISLAEGIDKYPIQDLWGVSGVEMYVKEGENYGTIYGYDYTYLDGKKVVKPVYDKSDPTKVVGTQYVTTQDLVPIGNATPKLTGGLSNTFRYKNFSLYFLTDFKLGGQIWSGDYSAAMGTGLSPETLKERDGGGLPYTFPDGTTANSGVILDGVFADGTPNTDVVNYLWKYAGQYEAWSNIPMPRSNAIFTNTWIKLREVTLSYHVPQKWIQRTKVIQGLDISLVGRNLFYLYTSLPDHLNPEAINGIGNGQGVQWAEYPWTRDYGFSIKVQF
ncbi:SusC/RagA family TonB-linked outer membrane protein [Arachidicoccus ginsenosidivorans]|uniref:SusC/RagA family TonB-linked outer membrane protein n=1 Tax=Arachidicoccus ginsenosidivorans TaxID=496057 RepID=A0A5B8VPU0_9BACT|nr:SusC/RagA family TonB-linked outer membrane protein [Arachidicoccus ginsenosidivorans]QEC73644.1 SusC/RagA family TonB-linked outer membrane protein [Arachidicoccus ginsenosidivorans]